MYDTAYIECSVYALVDGDPYCKIAEGMPEAMDLLDPKDVSFEDWCIAFDSVIANNWFDYIQVMIKYGYRNVHVTNC